MQYDAITLDANIFLHNDLYLEGGMLAQLSQFKEGSAQFVLSEIVVREVNKHLKAGASEATDALGKAIKKSNKNALLSTEAAAQIGRIYDAASSPGDAAKQRLQAFVNKSGAAVVPADQADIRELVKRYFAPAPPFEASGKKKNEFPDAIALLSLENWARSKNKKILAISMDAGWVDYAKNSDWIDVETDLAAALQKFQQHTEQAEAIVGSLLADLDTGKRPEFLQEIAEAIADGVAAMGVYGDASGAYYVEVEQVNMSYEDFRFLRVADEYEFKIVQVGKGKIVSRVGISTMALAEGELSFAVWDSVDKEYVPMGSGSAEEKVEFEAAILLTIEGNFIAEPPQFEISSVELVDTIDHVDFGDVEMDRGEDYYDE